MQWMERTLLIFCGTLHMFNHNISVEILFKLLDQRPEDTRVHGGGKTMRHTREIFLVPFNFLLGFSSFISHYSVTEGKTWPVRILPKRHDPVSSCHPTSS